MDTIYGEIEARRGSILKTWRAGLNREQGPSGLSSVQRTNSFTSSVASLVEEGTSDVVTWLVDQGSTAEIPETLVDLCRLKAVQEASPSLAFGFIFDLKRAIRAALNNTVKQRESAELDRVEQRIDELALVTFDWYSEFREKIYLIKVAELQRSEGFAQRRLAKRGDREREAV